MELALTVSPDERQHVEYLADLYAVIVAIEKVEKAMLRDLITQEQYEATIRRLLEKYKSSVSYLEQGRNPYYTTIDSFWENYGSKCPAARTRIQFGLTDKNQQQEDGHTSSTLVLECVQSFITLMDSLKLQQTAVDQLYTLLADLIQGLRRLGTSEQEFFRRLMVWKEKLDTMKASDELNERGAREFAFALESAYQSFYAYLRDPSKTNSGT
ncbi:vacuolar protein sorting-associated protein [Trypanosoma conorhini]|uniref:Vacuolar protein sorting-associated protein 28 homolog n=1 Tax=Trypanosoma conorhini TaxID=83891 RepID=A0A3R7L2Q8_9TRYP|nr:vacuolar protein sorting-associated protein [Trypanosoma conorhini]RNF18493.1 vacuolar protein sorting-associated protein [Trypanosoma conorhini]